MNHSLSRYVLYLFAAFCLGFGIILPANPALAEDITYPGNGVLRTDPAFSTPNSLFPDALSGNSVTVNDDVAALFSAAKLAEHLGIRREMPGPGHLHPRIPMWVKQRRP